MHSSPEVNIFVVGPRMWCRGLGVNIEGTPSPAGTCTRGMPGLGLIALCVTAAVFMVHKGAMITRERERDVDEMVFCRINL